MEKLLELMNEHAHTYAGHYDDTGEEITITFFSHTDNCFQYVCDGKYETLVDDVVISKRFGLIKRLIENDKINKDIISRVLIRAYVSPKNHVSLECEFYDYYESLLMILSISDTPIEDLILYLK